MDPNQQDPPDHDHIDGCICDVDIDAGELTDDADLPAAFGGVDFENAVADADGESDEESELGPEDATPDEELPIAFGGL